MEINQFFFFHHDNFLFQPITSAFKNLQPFNIVLICDIVMSENYFDFPDAQQS